MNEYTISNQDDVIILIGGQGIMDVWMHILGRNDTTTKEYLEKYILNKEFPYQKKGYIIKDKTITVSKTDTLFLKNEYGRVIDTLNLSDVFKFSAKTVKELLEEGYAIRWHVEGEEGENIEFCSAEYGGQEVYGVEFLTLYDDQSSRMEYIPKEELDEYAKELGL